MNKPTKTLAVLIIEDQESDAQLLIRLLKKADYDLVYEQVEAAGQMRAALEKRVIANHDNGFLPEGSVLEGYDASRAPGALTRLTSTSL